MKQIIRKYIPSFVLSVLTIIFVVFGILFLINDRITNSMFAYLLFSIPSAIVLYLFVFADIKISERIFKVRIVQVLFALAVFLIAATLFNYLEFVGRVGFIDYMYSLPPLYWILALMFFIIPYTFIKIADAKEKKQQD